MTASQQRELEESFRAVEEAPGWNVHSILSDGDARQDAEYEVDSSRSAFRGTVTVDPEGDPRTLVILRVRRITWVKAPEDYWTENGYDAESAAAAAGLFVPFEAVAGDQLAEKYDPVLLFEHLSGVDLSEVTDAGADGFDFGDGFFVSVRADGAVVVRSGTASARLEVAFLPAAEPIILEIPSREETYTAR